MAFGAYTEFSAGFSTSSPQTFSSPTVSGTDPHGVLGVLESGITLATPTWNGVSMTLKDTVSNFDGFGSNFRIYELDAPATGTISMSWTGGSTFLFAMAVYFTGVTGLRTGATATASTANASVSCTSVSGDEVLGMMAINSGTEPGAGTGMTLRGSVNISSDLNAGATGTEAATGTTHTVDFTNGAQAWGIWGAAWIPAGGGPATWGKLLALHNNRLIT